MIRPFLTLLLSGMLFCGCGDEALVQSEVGDLERVRLTPGFHRDSLSLGQGQVLRYSLSVPFVIGDKVPLVMALHQAGRITPYFGESYLKTLAEPALRSLGALIVAPDVPAASWIEPLSEEAVLAFIDLALEAWPVDPDRVVLTGYSAGGIGTWFLTGKHPTVFSAGLPVAADPVVGNLPGAGQVPLYVVHGREDELFEVEDVQQAVEALQGREAPVKLMVVEGLGHTAISGYVAPLQGAVVWLKDEAWMP